jgi:hypothetical protein
MQHEPDGWELMAVNAFFTGLPAASALPENASLMPPTKGACVGWQISKLNNNHDLATKPFGRSLAVVS